MYSDAFLARKVGVLQAAIQWWLQSENNNVYVYGYWTFTYGKHGVEMPVLEVITTT